MGSLDGKNALVTGGTAGIGLASARALAEAGAHVFLTGRNQSTIDAAVASIGSSATGIRSDVSDPTQLDAIVDAVTSHGGGLDAVFTNAGGGEFATLADVTVEHYLDTFNRNVAGTLFTVQKVLPLLNPGASIILSGSTAASRGNPVLRRLRRVQGRRPLVRPDLGRGTRRPGHPGQHLGARTDRDAGTHRPRAGRRREGTAGEPDGRRDAGAGRPARGDRRRGRVPRLARKQFHDGQRDVRRRWRSSDLGHSESGSPRRRQRALAQDRPIDQVEEITHLLDLVVVEVGEEQLRAPRPRAWARPLGAS